jgi:hypothetical protein
MQRAQRMQPFSRPWLLTVASSVAGLAIIGVYVAIIASQADDDPTSEVSPWIIEVWPWVLVMATAALLPVVALFSRNRAIVTWCLLGSAAIWTVMAAISLVVIPLPAVFLLAFAYASYRDSTKNADAQSDTAPLVSP